MYKKHATILVLLNLVMIAAFLDIREDALFGTRVREAFTLATEDNGQVLQAINYTGITQEAVSRQRILDMNLLTREEFVSVSQTDYENLLRIVEAEAGGEDKNGKILVANVVLNRVRSDKFPDTITEVIFQSENGTSQFSPISDGRFYTVTVSEETKKAVDEALLGKDLSQGALYFVARKYVSDEKMSWFDTKLTRLFEYGGHEFFS